MHLEVELPKITNLLKVMKIIKLGNKVKLQCPTIVKVADDYYLVSKKFYPNSFSNSNFQKAFKKGGLTSGNSLERYIAINIQNGEWFDWGEDIPCLNLKMETFEKGTKFEIEI